MKNLIGISGKMGSGKDTVAQIIQYLSDYNSLNYTHPITEKDFNSYLKNKRFSKKWKIKRFADKLKDITCMLIGCTREQLEDREFKKTPLGEEWKKFNYGVDDIENPVDAHWETITPRKLMQLIGTECGRQIIHPNIWVNALFSEYIPIIGNKGNAESDYPKLRELGIKQILPELPNWIITDMRFPNELKAVKDREGITIRVNRNKFSFSDYEAAKNYLIEKRGEAKGFLSNDGYSIVYEANTVFEKENKHSSETALDNYKDFDETIDNNGSIEDLIKKVEQILIKYNII